MKSINLDVQYEEYAINGDSNRVIRVNVQDANLIPRLEGALNEIKEFEEELKGSKDPEMAFKLDDLVKRKINAVFNSNISDIVFEGANCVTSIAKNGKTLFENFIDNFTPVLMEDLKAAYTATTIKLEPVNNDITDEYIKSVENVSGIKDTKTPFVPYAKPSIDVNSLTESERKALIAQLLA